jgi:hypothetical protein
MRLRTAILALFCLAFAGGLIANLAAYVRAAHSPAIDSQPPRLIPAADVHPYGANFFLAREVEPWKREKTVQMAREAGIAWARQHFAWEAIEPNRKGEFIDQFGNSSWQKYDEIVDLFLKYGLTVIARLDRPPNWTRQDNRYPQRPPDNFADYGDFVYEFVRHFKGRIHYVQLWNEPNIFPEWGDQPVDPRAYVELLKIGYTRAKQADPNVWVLSAPLAINTEDFPDRRNLSDLIYLDEMYQAGARDYFDILSANAFGMDQPPDAPPGPDVLNFRRVELQRQIMERYGDADKAIWFNEYGWNAAPETFSSKELIWKRVTEADQARFTVQGIELARRQWPWAGVFGIWYFRQPGFIPPDQADYYFRLVDVDFTPRLVYLAVQADTRRYGVAGPGLFQETNPAVQADRDWQPVIAPRAGARGQIESAEPGASLTFTFEGSDLDVLAERAPDAGRLLVSLDGAPVRDLPTDARGHSYRDLAAAGRQWQVRLPLVRDAGPGRHVLTLTVADELPPGGVGRRCAVDGFVVTGAAAPHFPAWIVFPLAVGLVLSAGLLARDLRGRK